MSHGHRGWFYLNRRNFDEAIREMNYCLDLDPLSPLFYAWSACVYWCTGRFDESLQQFPRVLEIAPQFGLAYFNAGIAYSLKGLLDEAVETLEQGRELPVPPGWIEGPLGLTYLKKGDREKAQVILEGMIESRKTIKNTSPAFIAFLAGELGKLDLAFEYLDKACEERDSAMVNIHIHGPMFSPAIAADPRYKSVLARMKLNI